MYIAQETFTSKHNHHYDKGQEVTNFVYLTLAEIDKTKFKKKDEFYEGQQTVVRTMVQDDFVTYDEGPIIDPLTAVIIMDEIVNDVSVPFEVVQPNASNDFGAFEGGSGGGGGASGSWNNDQVIQGNAIDDIPTTDTYDDACDRNDSYDSSDSYSSD